MPNDAAEAALGLLGLSPANLLPPSLIPFKRKQSALASDETPNSEAIRCICGFTYDDGFSIACDDCSRWCHAACFDIVEGLVPEEWRCWECVVRPVDREKAIRVQLARQGLVQMQLSETARRRTSPGVERKHRRASAAAIDGGKRKRRTSIIVPTEDEHVDIDEPWTHSYAPITADVVPHPETRDKLRRHAQRWRGITALSPPSPSQTTTIQPLPNSSFSHPTLSANTNPSVRPPSYAVHTTTAIPSSHFITPFTSTVTPSAAYLADPLNAYAHLGLPKPFVHLLGPPLDLALDARITGDSARFVRSGCRPNAVLRPVLCRPPHSSSLSFGIFALRDIKAHEEVVLGWEWDDSNAVHTLPALIETPDLFPPPHIEHLRSQMAGILHALGSTFTTCACGATARDCALTRMAAFVDGQDDGADAGRKVDLGPLVGAQRGFRTREKVPYSGGMNGVEMVQTGEGAKRTTKRRKQRITIDTSVRPPHGPESQSTETSGSVPRSGRDGDHSQLQDDDDGTTAQEGDGVTGIDEPEDKMPPKMRKRWIHRGFEALKEVNAHDREGGETMDVDVETAGGRVDDERGLEEKGVAEGAGPRTTDTEASYKEVTEKRMRESMPPPPIPISRTVKASLSSKVLRKERDQVETHKSEWEAQSPSASFAQLSLLSPAIGGPAGAQEFWAKSTPSRASPTPTAELEPASIAAGLMTTTPFVLPSPPSMVPSSPSTAASNSFAFNTTSLRAPATNGPTSKPESSLTYPWMHTYDNRGSTTAEVCAEPPKFDTAMDRDVATDTTAAADTAHALDVDTPMPAGADLNLASTASLSCLLTNDPASEERVPGYPMVSTVTGDVTLSHPVESSPQHVPFPVSDAEVDAPSTSSQPEPSVLSLNLGSLSHSSPASQPMALQTAISPAPPSPLITPAISPLRAPTTLPRGASTSPSSPPQQPKVKMSLKDFALRKKRQREEEMMRGGEAGEESAAQGSDVEVKAGMNGVNEVGNGDGNDEGLKRAAGPGFAVTGGRVADTGSADAAGEVTKERGDNALREVRSPIVPPSLTRTLLTSLLNGAKGANDQGSLEAKIELVEKSISPSPTPNGVVIPEDGVAHQTISPSPPDPPPPPLNGFKKFKSRSPLPAQAIQFHSSFKVDSVNGLREDGEIHSGGAATPAPSFSSPPPRSKINGRPPTSVAPRAHTPPTQPRSFHTENSSPNIDNPPLAAPLVQNRIRRPLPHQPTPLQPHHATTNIDSAPAASLTPVRNRRPPQLPPPPQPPAGPSRPLPSGPRALRGINSAATALGGQHSPTTAPGAVRPLGSAIPRGPSADRERMEWERERAWPQRVRGRGGTAGPGTGWGR